MKTIQEIKTDIDVLVRKQGNQGALKLGDVLDDVVDVVQNGFQQVNNFLDKFKTILRSLAKDGCITHDSLDAWFGVSKVQAEREFLTADEVRKLVDTPCIDDDVKRMFLFSCFTGFSATMGFCSFSEFMM